MAGGDYITEDRARLIMVDMFKDYETEIITPRHAQTQGKLADIEAIVNKGKGAIMLASAIISVGGFLWIVLQIRDAIRH